VATHERGRGASATCSIRKRCFGARASRATRGASGDAPSRTRHIPAAVRREVYDRDGGRCTFVASDGTRCGDTRRLEFDHASPWARGGESTAANLRLRCSAHNALAAEQAYGRAHIERKVRLRRELRGSQSLLGL
jgi:5-methylcytosine-specific restriction endonuclease McrA